MIDFEEIERIKAEAKILSLNPNALAASGLGVKVERISYKMGFGENGFLNVAAHCYAAILPVLAESRGFEMIGESDGEPVFVRRYEAA
jgi:hypothetical protein